MDFISKVYLIKLSSFLRKKKNNRKLYLNMRRGTKKKTNLINITKNTKERIINYVFDKKYRKDIISKY